MNARGIRLLAPGTALPGPPVATAALARHLGLTAEQGRDLEAALGIRFRHLCRDLGGRAPHATLTDLATTAAERALAAADTDAGDVDAVVMSTATPDGLMPATVNLVADRLGIDQVPSYQIQAGATGALQAIDLAAQLLSTGRRHTVLVLAGDVSTKLSDLTPDPGEEPAQAALTTATFGDGAAAVVVTSSDRPDSHLLCRVAVRRGTADLPPGQTADWLGAAKRGTPGRLVTYDQALVADVAPKLAANLLTELLDDLGWGTGDLVCLLPPQLPGGLAAATAELLLVPPQRCAGVIEEIGHAPNALPLFQLARAWGRTGPGDRLAGVAVDPSGWATARFALQRVR
ncbi:hypothetical protein AB0F52_48470 [Amycolatopsis sp. NPDC024027]|uniref:thiolase family protein n=1 Tax=Amycolatopsis sp. NPDC024027 TaxID=3154327 RepID=UPI0033C17233